MARGRKRQPPELQKAKGYPGRRKGETDKLIEASADTPDAATVSTAPSDLDEAGRDKWHELYDALSRSLVLKSTDLDTLHLYCAAWSDWRTLRKKLGSRFTVKTRSPHVTMVRRNPLAAELEKKRREVSELGRDLGLTPSTRLGIVVRQADTAKPGKGRYAARDASKQPGGDTGKKPVASPLGILKAAGQRPN